MTKSHRSKKRQAAAKNREKDKQFTDEIKSQILEPVFKPCPVCGAEFSLYRTISPFGETFEHCDACYQIRSISKHDHEKVKEIFKTLKQVR
jgi:hypothetical protein